jgi:predicted  nucleic acid-binding Zn-ribbon protein
MLLNDIHLNELKASIIRLRGRVELYEGSTLTSICHCGDSLQEFTVERTGENRFYGFGICQKLHGILIDHYQKINVTNKHSVEVAFGVNENFVYPYPKFYIQEYKRNEEDGTIEFAAYDKLFKAEGYTLNDLNLRDTYNIKAMAAACAQVLDLPLRFINIDEETLNTGFTKGVDANFSGEESLRRILDAIAEFTQSIYFINSNWELVFKRLNPAEELALAINRRQYISFENGGERRLKNIASVTEGEDNVETVGEGEGVTQYIRDNPFYTLRTDLASLLEKAQANVGGMTMSQYNVEWSGNYLLEIGDRISLEGKNTTLYSYLLDDSITFDGGLYQKTSWSFEDNEGERASNPITIGEALNQTFIKVDKANRRIDMAVKESTAATEAVAELTITTNGISQSVSQIEKNVQEIEDDITGVNTEVTTVKKSVTTLDTTVSGISGRVSSVEGNINSINGEITNVKKSVSDLNITANGISASVTSIEGEIDGLEGDINGLDGEIKANKEAIGAIEISAESINSSITTLERNVSNRFDNIEGEFVDVSKKVETMVTQDTFEIGINKVIDNGVKKVETSTGFTFDEQGLTISKTNSEMTTQITEDGMKVYRSSTEVLTADNEGVKAEDLHATTYLIIGGNSRFEDYGSGRTGCFWIGG